MTGLCGWLNFAGPLASPAEALREMSRGLVVGPAPEGGVPEGSFSTGVRAGLCLARPAPDGHFCSGDRYMAAICGRPYWTHREIDAIAAERGQAAALIESFERFGTGLFDHLQGTFSLALLDLAENVTLIAIDRMGIGRMCHARGQGGDFAFGSSTDSIRAYPGIEATIDPQQVFNYLFWWRIPAPRTIYREQDKLLPGQYLLYRGDVVAPTFYWQMPYEDRAEGTLEELGEELHEKLRVAVGRTISGEDPERVGAFLSGGLDSSTIVGLMREATGKRARTFTIGFSVEGYDENAYAQLVAKHFDTEHHEYFVSPQDIVDSVPAIASAYDEPFANASAIPTYYCARLAKMHGVDVMLAGDGGDELFAGNSRYVGQKIFDLYSLLPGVLRRFVIEPLILDRAVLDRLPVTRKMRSYIQRARIPLPDRLETYNYYWSANVGEILAPALCEAVDPTEPLRIMREVYERTSSRSVLKRLMHVDLQTILADSDLRKVNMMCELAGTRVRYPFLDDDMMGLAARIPSELLVKGRRLRFFYKQTQRGFLPDKVLTKHKHGFGLPIEHWLRNHKPLRELACDNLSSLKRRSYLRPDFVDKVLHALGNDNDTFPLGGVFDLMVFESWLQKHLDRSKY